ncbi:unnamed protein product [Cladocopium goreaui]|uniref:Uncharacterized protein n=1 Tax=Cladocopium goreaui TaxID=2562237 RepID=A0A9P1GTS0_9DINO|nr:unnamed protein product [Cladocopium goreaui]
MKDKKGNKAKTNDQETEPKLKEVEKDLVKTKKRDRDDDDDEKDGKKNSSTHRKEWQTFGRWVKNKKRCPAKTMEDPEFPGEDEFLYFVLIEFNIEDIKEYKRITALEMTGTLDPDGVKAFVDAGGCLDGKQHLALGDKLGAEGVAKMLGSVGLKGDASATKTKKGKGQRKPKVTPETPLEKAVKLQEKVLKDANSCRDFAFKLRPISMSNDLIQQLKACAVKLQTCAEQLQQKIRNKKDKNKHYVAILAEVTEITNMAKERVDLAKALIRAVDKPRPKSRAKPGEGEKPLAITNGEATAA